MMDERGLILGQGIAGGPTLVGPPIREPVWEVPDRELDEFMGVAIPALSAITQDDLLFVLSERIPDVGRDALKNLCVLLAVRPPRKRAGLIPHHHRPRRGKGFPKPVCRLDRRINALHPWPNLCARELCHDLLLSSMTHGS